MNHSRADVYLKYLLNIFLILFTWNLILSITGVFYCLKGNARPELIFSNLFLCVSSVCCLLVLLSLRGLVKSIDSTPFAYSNIKRLVSVGYIFLIASVFDLISNIMKSSNYVIFEVIGLKISLTTLFLLFFSLVSFVLANIFLKAIKLKEENDLMI